MKHYEVEFIYIINKLEIRYNIFFFAATRKEAKYKVTEAMRRWSTYRTGNLYDITSEEKSLFVGTVNNEKGFPVWS